MLPTRSVSDTSLLTGMPFVASNVRCGGTLQLSLTGRHDAELRPLPYSPSMPNQPLCLSLSVRPLDASQRWSWSAGVQSSGAPKHGASSCVSQPLLTEYVCVSEK